MLIARNLGPAELLEYDKRRLKAVVLEEGSLTAHMTIVARAMGVPVVGKLPTIRHVASEGDVILVDGDSGTVVVRPSRPLSQGFEQRMAMSQKRRAEYAALKDLPAETTDGVKVSLMVNAGLAEDAAMLEASGADGIGLFRTEFQFLVSAALPGRESQQRLYKSVLDAAGRQAGGVPHGRYRRRQGVALSQRRQGRSGESGDGLARASPQPGTIDADEGAGARA